MKISGKTVAAVKVRQSTRTAVDNLQNRVKHGQTPESVLHKVRLSQKDLFRNF